MENRESGWQSKGSARDTADAVFVKSLEAGVQPVDLVRRDCIAPAGTGKRGAHDSCCERVGNTFDAMGRRAGRCSHPVSSVSSVTCALSSCDWELPMAQGGEAYDEAAGVVWGGGVHSRVANTSGAAYHHDISQCLKVAALGRREWLWRRWKSVDVIVVGYGCGCCL